MLYFFHSVLIFHFTMTCISQEEQEISEASGGVASKAEVRPTAYLPLVGREGYVPHPYGAQAPFKPYPPSAAMRRFRKPKSRPIEI